jgi:hypothetical protein
MNLEDLGIVLTELFGVKEKWFNIGLQLSVPVKDLQQIFSEHKNDHSTGLRLRHAHEVAGNGRGQLEITEQSAEQPNRGREQSSEEIEGEIL